MPDSPNHDDEIPKRLDKETINELPLIRFHGAIQVAEDSKSFNRFAARLKKQRVLDCTLDRPQYYDGYGNRRVCADVVLLD